MTLQFMAKCLLKKGTCLKLQKLASKMIQNLNYSLYLCCIYYYHINKIRPVYGIYMVFLYFAMKD